MVYLNSVYSRVSKHVNEQRSDSSVSCVRVYQSNCTMIPFHLFEALVPAEAVGADQRTTQLPPPNILEGRELTPFLH